MSTSENVAESQKPQIIVTERGGILHPFEKGKSGNLSGRGKGVKNFKTLIGRVLDEKMVLDVDGQPVEMTRQEAIVHNLINMALNSPNDAIKLRAIMELIDRIDGKPVPVLPDNQGDQQSDAIVFYIPNEHSRLK
jgi:hypothetical protein